MTNNEKKPNTEDEAPLGLTVGAREGALLGGPGIFYFSFKRVSTLPAGHTRQPARATAGFGLSQR